MSNAREGENVSEKIVRSQKKSAKVKRFFRIAFAGVKRISDTQAQKKEHLKQAKNSSIKPRGYAARKAGKIIFWLLFGFMILVVMMNLFSGGNKTQAKTEAVPVVNKATSPEAVQFAQDFARDFLTWNSSSSGQSDHANRLAKYLANDLDPDAGLQIQNTTVQKSIFDASEVKDIEDKGNDCAEITLLVSYDVTKAKAKKPQTVSKYLVVPVTYTGNSFSLYQLPRFTFINENAHLSQTQDTTLRQVSADTQSRVEAFLPTFFKAYTVDSQDQLNYFLTSSSVTTGLNNTLNFVSIDNDNIYVGKGNNSYLAFVQATFSDPDSGIQFSTNYQLTITNMGKRYVVSGISDHITKGVVTGFSQSN